MITWDTKWTVGPNGKVVWGSKPFEVETSQKSGDMYPALGSVSTFFMK